MIKSIRHKGLLLYYEQGNGSKLPAEQLKKISRMLTALDAVSSEADIMALGNKVHKLKGSLGTHWSLSVTGNFRLIFRFSRQDIYDIDLLDYH